MMIWQGIDDFETFGFGLITVTGYKAGINPYVIFPKDENTHGITARWLSENWAEGGDTRI